MRDQNGFAGQRDDICRDYAKESVHGYCALRVTQARTALLETRLNEFAAAAAGKAASEKPGKTKPKKATPTSHRAGHARQSGCKPCKGFILRERSASVPEAESPAASPSRTIAHVE